MLPKWHVTTRNLAKRVLFKYHTQYTFKMELFQTAISNVFWNLSLKKKHMKDLHTHMLLKKLHTHVQHRNATTHTTEAWEPSADCSLCNYNNITQIVAVTLPHQNVCFLSLWHLKDKVGVSFSCFTDWNLECYSIDCWAWC